MTFVHPVTTVDLLRHGEPLGGQKYRGSLDDPLSPQGWSQMQQVVDAQEIAWQQIVTSPMVRCADFSRKLGETRSVPVHVEPAFREMGFGLWEGKSKQTLLADERFREHLLRFWKNPRDNPPPEGESIPALHDRVCLAWQDMISRCAGTHLLLVAHSGVIRVILSMLLGIPQDNLSRLSIPFAALSRIRLDHIDHNPIPQLLFFNRGGVKSE